MSVIILLIIFSLLIAIGFLMAFIWSIKDDQYEDMYTPSVRILLDEEPENKSEKFSKEDL